MRFKKNPVIKTWYDFIEGINGSNARGEFLTMCKLKVEAQRVTNRKSAFRSLEE